MNEIKKIELVAAYIRVSSQEQKLHGLSLDAQKMKLQDYADKNNMKIVEWYMDEGVSGRKLIRKRPELQRMIQDAENGAFEKIIFIKLDRFFRSVAEYHECMKRISPVVWTTTEEKYDLSTANGRMFVNMKLTIAELEADQTGERIKIVNDYKVRSGQPLVGDRCLPMGFKNEIDPITGKKKVVKDKDYEKIVEDLLDFMFTHQSKRKAIIYLQEKYGVYISYDVISKFLKNPLICGEYRGNKSYCESYITREQFDRLQEITRSQVKHNTVRRDYIFSGLIKCPICGNLLTGCPHTTIKPDGKRYKYKRYRCRKHYTEHNCSFSKFVSENILEKMLLEDLERFFNEEKIRANNINSKEENNPKYNVEKLKEQVKRLNYSWQTGKIFEVEDYEKQYNELIRKIEEARLEKPKYKTQDFNRIDKILSNGWKELYNNLNPNYKRAFWRSFIKQIEIDWTTNKKEIKRIVFF